MRWSLDLRFQRPDCPTGFYGLKDSLVLSKQHDPGYKPDWENWGKVDRGQLQEQKMGRDSKDALTAEYGDAVSEAFDVTIHGPWMDQWEIVNHNQHTAAHDIHPGVSCKA